jgi:hypothetical protein
MGKTTSPFEIKGGRKKGGSKTHMKKANPAVKKISPKIADPQLLLRAILTDRVPG